jgi:hypothetical protein
MGFWVFMMFMDLLIPFTMLGFGKYFIKNAPKEINMVFGYRTTRSMRNKDTWKFAHSYCGKLWLKIGVIMLILSVIAMLFVIGKDVNDIGTFGGILCAIQIGFLIGSIFSVERAIKNNFDEQGNRIKV